MSKSKFSAVVLLCSDGFGVYVPQYFAESYNSSVWGVKPEDETILLTGPEHEYYWKTWDDVLGYARYKDKDDNEFCLYQDGDLWAICYEKMSDVERINFGFDPE